KARALSLAYGVKATEQTVATPFRGGALARFEVRRMHGVTGEVEFVLPSGERVPAKYGEMTLDDAGVAIKSPLGSTGRFFIESISPGVHVAQVVLATGTCTVSLKVPESAVPIQSVGHLTCAGAPLLAGGLRTLNGQLFLDENGD